MVHFFLLLLLAWMCISCCINYQFWTGSCANKKYGKMHHRHNPQHTHERCENAIDDVNSCINILNGCKRNKWHRVVTTATTTATATITNEKKWTNDGENRHGKKWQSLFSSSLFLYLSLSLCCSHSNLSAFGKMKWCNNCRHWNEVEFKMEMWPWEKQNANT